MKNFVLLLLIGGLIAGTVAAYEWLNPPPPAEYEIVYFGSTTCGACAQWKRTDLVAWRQDPASGAAVLHMADLPGGRGAWTGGYGRHHDTFMAAFGERRSISWPSFVLLNHGEVVRVKSGAGGFRAISQEVRREYQRQQRREASA